MLLHFEQGLRKLWRGNGNLGYKRRIERPADGKFEAFFRKHFKEITGFDVTRAQEFKAEVKRNNGYLKPRDRKGPEPEKLEEDYPDLKAWVDLKVEQASRGSYLTIKRLMDKFKLDFIKPDAQPAGPLQPGKLLVEPALKMPGKEVFRRALHNMDFNYTKRRVKRLEARQSPEVLKELDKFLEWTIMNHLYGPSKYEQGKMVYSYKPTLRVAFGDESYMDSSEYRDMSWTSDKMKFKDFLKRSKRLVMVHIISSHKNKDDNNKWKIEPAFWSTEWKKKQDNFRYYGKTNGDNLEKIYGEALFGIATATGADEVILYLDNYSAHKRIRKELRGTAEDILKWVTDDRDEVNDETRSVIHALEQSAAQAGKDVDRKELLIALQNGGVPLYALEVLAKGYNGAQVKYLPAYYSELNPIELLWAEVKRYYRDETSTSDKWEDRMAEAWDSITPQFIESCFDRSIRWALKKHKERMEEKATASAPEAEAEHEDEIEPDEEDQDEDDYLYEELLAEQDIEAMSEDLE